MSHTLIHDASHNIYKINILSFLVVVYVFFNTIALPIGLSYTTIMAPFLYLYLLKSDKKLIISKFILALSPFLLISSLNKDIHLFDLMQSSVMLMGIYITIYYLTLLLTKSDDFKNLFYKIIKINFYFLLIALLLKYTNASSLMWSDGMITWNADAVSRLKLFMYEPSIYSTILIPFFVFAFVNFLKHFNLKTFFYLLAILIPLLLSFSLGVISALLLAIILSCFVHYRFIFFNKKIVILILILLTITLTILLTENIVSQRILNVTAGVDSSGNNRLYDSTLIAYQIAESTNILFGAGLGQVKYLAPLFFIQLPSNLELYRLTNAVADTLATFGIFGLIVRFIAEFYLFIYTKVLKSYFRTILFIFIFIYQFTGSYLMNLAEYFIWLLAFKPIFLEPKLKKFL